ncbi:ATP-binding protein [Tenuifilum osseticum]|uniref:ATP-binding protein n=1 Tax=Tenuifilum osseticum TaxID=3374723 RepID=UPI0034E445FE
MKDLSLHILDIVQNSVVAGAKVIQIIIEINTANDYIEFTVKDNGKGMEQEFLKRVVDPFTTTRTTRKVGLGIPLLKQNAELTGGTFSIDSEPGVGTALKARFVRSHIDCLPLGDLGGTIALLLCSYPDIEFKVSVVVDTTEFSVSTSELRQALDGVPLNEPSVYPLVKEYIYSNLDELQITNLS